MELLTYDDAIIWLNVNLPRGPTVNAFQIEEAAKTVDVTFKQDALIGLLDWTSGTVGENDPGSRNNARLARRLVR